VIVKCCKRFMDWLNPRAILFAWAVVADPPRTVRTPSPWPARNAFAGVNRRELLDGCGPSELADSEKGGYGVALLLAALWSDKSFYRFPRRFPPAALFVGRGLVIACNAARGCRWIVDTAALVHQPATVLAHVSTMLLGDPRIYALTASPSCARRPWFSSASPLDAFDPFASLPLAASSPSGLPATASSPQPSAVPFCSP